MKTIYTDKYGLMPIMFAILGVGALLRAGDMQGKPWGMVFWCGMGLVGLALAARALLRRRAARKANSDSSIYKVVEKNAKN